MSPPHEDTRNLPAAAVLSDAVSRGDFTAAEAACRDYARQVGALSKSLPLPQAADVVQEGYELLEWSRQSLCASRARLAEELRRIQNLRQYADRSPGRQRFLHLQA